MGKPWLGVVLGAGLLPGFELPAVVESAGPDAHAAASAQHISARPMSMGKINLTGFRMFHPTSGKLTTFSGRCFAR